MSSHCLSWRKTPPSPCETPPYIALCRGGSFNWETIHGLFINAVYGGRIDNDYDLRVLVTYLHQYFNDDMLAGTGPGRGRLAKGVIVPQSGNYNDYVQLVDSLPGEAHRLCLVSPPPPRPRHLHCLVCPHCLCG